MDYSGDVALACRVLAAKGVTREITGHVSVRSLDDPDEVWVRCRSRSDRGVAQTTRDDVHLAKLDLEDPEVAPGYKVPGEYAIHAELYRARPDVGAVVHGHPTAALLAGVTGVPVKPWFGAFEPYAMRLASTGVPVYPRSVLISNPALGQELARCMGEANVAILRGHGIVAVGGTLIEAALNAVRLELLCQVSLDVASVGSGQPVEERDVADIEAFLQEQGESHKHQEWVWDMYTRELESSEPTDLLP